MVNLATEYLRSAFSQDVESLESCEVVSSSDKIDIEVEKHLNYISSKVLLILFNEQQIPESYRALNRTRSKVRLYENALYLAYNTYCIQEVYEPWFANLLTQGFKEDILPTLEQTREEVLQRLPEIQQVLLEQ